MVLYTDEVKIKLNGKKNSHTTSFKCLGTKIWKTFI